MGKYLVTSLSILLLGIVGQPVNAASAQSDEALPCQKTAAIKAEILERISYYAFLVDNWSASGTQKEWVEEMFAADAVLEGFDTNGGKLLDLKGRDAIAAAFVKEGKSKRSSNHFIPNTYFEETSCDRVVTRSKGFTFSVKGEDDTQTKHNTFIYRDVWIQEAGEWRKLISHVSYIE